MNCDRSRHDAADTRPLLTTNTAISLPGACHSHGFVDVAVLMVQLPRYHLESHGDQTAVSLSLLA